jgi:type IX secretion system PorP/SprF family membrane protein
MFVASVAGRKQWIGFPGAPETEYISGAARINTKKNIQIGQIGFKAFHDNIGYTQLLNVSTSYSYSVKLKKNLLMNMGFAISVQQVSYDMSKSNLETTGDPAIYVLENKKLTNNTDLGVEFVGKSILIGASSQNFASLFTKESKLQTNTNFLYFMYRTKIDNSFTVQTGVCAVQNENLNQMEFNISGFINPKNRPELFQLGVSYRTKNEFGVLFGIDLGRSVRLAFSYDYHLGGISRSSFGTPEMLLVWKFGKLEDCKCRELFK